MKIRVIRNQFDSVSSIGSLYIDGVFQCFTLEDVDRKLESGGTKVYGDTAIPRGIYSVRVSFSNRFQTRLPELLDVPGFDGIRIHAGNTAADTHGCILVGSTHTRDRIGGSRIAFDRVFPLIDAAFRQGDAVEISIE